MSLFEDSVGLLEYTCNVTPILHNVCLFINSESLMITAVYFKTVLSIKSVLKRKWDSFNDNDSPNNTRCLEQNHCPLKDNDRFFWRKWLFLRQQQPSWNSSPLKEKGCDLKDDGWFYFENKTFQATRLWVSPLLWVFFLLFLMENSTICKQNSRYTVKTMWLCHTTLFFNVHNTYQFHTITRFINS